MDHKKINKISLINDLWEMCLNDKSRYNTILILNCNIHNEWNISLRI